MPEQDIVKGIAYFRGLARVFYISEVLGKYVNCHGRAPKREYKITATSARQIMFFCSKNVHDFAVQV